MRDDDVIACEAQGVGPFEVETALLAHPAVAEAAVIGVPDQVTTERVKAYIIPHEAYTRARASWPKRSRPTCAHSYRRWRVRAR
ncbi:MAG: hypothetical protein ABR577_18510 [Pyrinomonadaceae bacterium]